VRGLQMKAREIGPDAIWRKGEAEIPLLGSLIPVPTEVQQGKAREEGLFLVEARAHFEDCPRCDEPVGDGIIIVMETARMFPAHCCDTILWFMEDDKYAMETYG
jgi:hypothetical protein